MNYSMNLKLWEPASVTRNMRTNIFTKTFIKFNTESIYFRDSKQVMLLCCLNFNDKNLNEQPWYGLCRKLIKRTHFQKKGQSFSSKLAKVNAKFLILKVPLKDAKIIWFLLTIDERKIKKYKQKHDHQKEIVKFHENQNEIQNNRTNRNFELATIHNQTKQKWKHMMNEYILWSIVSQRFVLLMAPLNKLIIC